MLRNALIVLILVLLALCVADARLPKAGDNVVVSTNSPTPGHDNWFKGEITDIGDGLICLSCTADMTDHVSNFNFPYDVCIGVGSITSLTWF